MNEVGDTLEHMNAVQLVAALLFVAGYVVSLGHLATERGRRWGAGTAVVSSMVFVVFTHPWEHGIILVVLASAAVGVFVAFAWMANRYFEHRQQSSLALPQDADDTDGAGDTPEPGPRGSAAPHAAVSKPASMH